MPKKKDKSAEIIVTDKDYLRDVSTDIADDVLASRSSPVLFLYRTNESRYYSAMRDKAKSYILIHGCKEGNGKPQECTPTIGSYSLICKHCGSKISTWNRTGLSTPECDSDSNGRKTIKSTDLIYASKHPENDDTVIIRLLAVGYSYEKEADGTYKIVTSCDCKTALEIIPGVSVKGYKVLKRSIKEIPAFEAMNINSQTINSTWARTFLFQGAVNAIDFLNKNKIFSERTGLHEALKMLPSDMRTLNIEPYILLHLCMISEYPVLELLIKMGYSKLYYDLIRMFIRAQSKDDILQKVKFFQCLFTTSSKGSMGLRIPAYIGDYLKTKAAAFDEYKMWCDIYELQAMSKEQFEKYISSNEYISANIERAISVIPNILKYGYTIEQATKYLYKQWLVAVKRNEERVSFLTLSTEMRDYLTMCEYLEITPNKFPQDIHEAHNEIQKLRSSTKRTDYSKMASVGKTTQQYLDSFINPAELTEMEESYFIKVPVSEQDFVEEGNHQNSCVGHYARKVNAGERVVFFVRKKDEPNSSFITAEYVVSTESLGQCMYANNREVEDKDLINYCKVACGRIKTGLLMGKIN